MAAAPYIPPSFGQPGVSISYQPKPLLCSNNHDQRANFPIVTVAVPPASIHHIFAHRQWRAGMLMSDALLSSAFPTANRTILELGAGTGLPSITAALIGDASLVVASDYDEPLLVKELRDNVKRNLASASELVTKRCKVVGHIWGKDTEELIDCLPRGVKAFDSVLLADCMWDPLSHADLLKTVVKVLSRDRGARVNIIAGLHTGREKVTSFIRRAYRVGLRLAPVDREDLWPALPQDALNEDPDVARAGNEAFAHAKHRILELEVCGNTPIQQQSADSTTTTTTTTTTNQDGNDDQPRLTGNRRLFLIQGYGQDAEGDVKLRNRWLTVWSLEWANP
ncbi:related to NNT1 - putative nicotinamide N-methyltransferase [Ustilago trichophora]|uniref:Related to NNT1 - putative nicotinamide N-methyltransferase n=1 Tax=Ustilago trichophora TaxID=86804 RepID=A0A5C3DVV8_9BASI|nr:related to NNT1 - putative nicotinamide N-methyltransferase [Ustilago trichophora]